jgi:predicted nucleic-acid-binding Zn-ribbon protein
MKCLACGNRHLVEGTISDGTSTDISLKLKDDSWFKKMLNIGNRPVRAYGCITCGHLQLGVEFSEEDKQKYQEFDDQQPSVLERLKSDHD